MREKEKLDNEKELKERNAKIQVLNNITLGFLNNKRNLG